MPCSMISVLYANIMGHYAFDLEMRNLTMMSMSNHQTDQTIYNKADKIDDLSFEDVAKSLEEKEGCLIFGDL